MVGEAVFVDLGGGRQVISIFGFGPKGDGPPAFHQLAQKAFGLPVGEDEWKALAGRRDAAELPSRLIPTLVTFGDVNDPTTARVVRPEEFEREFGPGVRFRRATIEMVSPGTWPLTLFGIGGEPVTRGIEGKIPGLPDAKSWNEKLNRLPFDRNRLMVGSRALKRE